MDFIYSQKIWKIIDQKNSNFYLSENMKIWLSEDLENIFEQKIRNILGVISDIKCQILKIMKKY